MRVFTQRINLQLDAEIKPNNWSTPPLGLYPEHDQFIEEFEQLFPDTIPKQKHDLDYALLFDPVRYVTGRYWGGESSLAAAVEFAKLRNIANYYRNIGTQTSVLVCEDSEHPTTLTTEQIFTSYGLHLQMPIIDPTSTLAGYWLATDPETFVSVA